MPVEEHVGWWGGIVLYLGGFGCLTSGWESETDCDILIVQPPGEAEG